jgi:hypothetical protein
MRPPPSAARGGGRRQQSAARTGLPPVAIPTGERLREPRPRRPGHPRRPLGHRVELDGHHSGAAAVASSTNGGRRRGEDSILVRWVAVQERDWRGGKTRRRRRRPCPAKTAVHLMRGGFGGRGGRTCRPRWMVGGVGRRRIDGRRGEWEIGGEVAVRGGGEGRRGGGGGPTRCRRRRRASMGWEQNEER